MVADTLAMERARGGALGRWGAVETQIYLLFLSLFPFTSESADAPVMFKALRSLENKIRLVDAMARHKLPATLSAEWKTLVKDINTAKDTRNVLAHWAIFQNGDRIEFAPHQFEPVRGGNAPEAMNADDLQRIGNNLTALARRIHLLAQKVKLARAPQA